ncbi:MAG: phosphotransferase [Burkholderiaceae bacterium]
MGDRPRVLRDAAFVDGRVLWEQPLPGLAPSDRGAIYDEMNRVIAALHSVSPGHIGLADYGKPGNYFVRQIARWTKQYQLSALQPIAEMDRLIDWLPAHLPPSALDESQVSIVHGDFRLDNLIFEANSRASRPCSTGSCRRSGIRWPISATTAWRGTSSPAYSAASAGSILTALGIPNERDYVRRYCERTGRADPDAVKAHWNFYLAYNLFRLAAITQGIAKRAADGTAASAQAQSSGQATSALARMGWAQAQRG